MKKGNWVPMDKGLVKTMSNINRPFSVVEAMFSYSVDQDCCKEGTLRGYAKLWGWSVGKVKRFVECLRNTSETVVERKGNGSGTVVRFVDGSLKRLAEQKRNGSGTVAEHKRVATIYPNPNPEPKVIKSTVEKPSVFNGEVGEVFTYWQDKLNHPRAKLDDKRKKKITALFKIGYTAEDLKTAIDGCKSSPFHQGQNNRSEVYDDIELICRDASHVDKFIKTASLAGSSTQLSQYGKRAVEVAKSWLENSNGNN